MFLDIGVSSFLTQKLSRLTIKSSKNKNNRLIPSSIGFLLLISIFLVPIIIAVTFYFENIFSLNIIISNKTKFLIGMSMIISLINLFLKPYTSLLYSEEKLLSVTLFSNLSFVIYNLLSVILVYYNFGINSFFYALIISNLIYLSFILFYFFLSKRRNMIKVSIPKKKEVLYFINGGFFLFINGIAAQIIYNGDRILVAKFVSISSLTYFTINIRAIEIIQVLVMKITDFFIPKIVKITTVSIQNAIEYYYQFTKLSTVIVLYIIVNFLLFNKCLIKLWVGSEMIISDFSIILFYLIICFSNIIFRIPSIFLYAYGKNRQYSMFSILDAILNLCFSIIFVKFFELKGIVLASIFATFLTSVPSNLYLLKKYFDIRDKWFVFLKPIFLPVIYSTPLLVLSYFGSSYALEFIHNWFQLFEVVIFFNLTLTPVFIFINYKNIRNFILNIKKINNGIYR